MNLLTSYINGNTQVKIHTDGTKERTVTDYPVTVLHPESIDVKITNYCDLACSWCHEMSTVKGKHADLEALLLTLSSLPPGVELAIGGGNPMSHPELKNFLIELKKKGFIPNITVNSKHICQYEVDLCSFVKDSLVYGVGVSYDAGVIPMLFSSRRPTDGTTLFDLTPNVVFHLIAGVHNISAIDALKKALNEKILKVLTLGYKTYGLGVSYTKNPAYRSPFETKMYEWYTHIGAYLKKEGITFSFDNLALEQLKVKRFFPSDMWDRFYMGDDGIYTMYIDGVKQEYAKSSTSPNRVSFSNMPLLTYFNRLNKL